MILSAHQPAYIPWLGFFHKIALSDVFVILDSVQFEKNSFTNRNKIKTSNGESWLTIPIEQKGNFGIPITEMNIFQGMQWTTKHYKTIYSNYKKAGYFDEHFPFFENFFSVDYSMLCEPLKIQLEYLLRTLGINTKIYYLSELPVAGKKQELILNLCNYFYADKFVFGKLGADYADNDYFKSHGINIYFQDYFHPVYKQLWGDFVPYLSIIDLLFNEGKGKALNILMQNNISKEQL